MIHFKISLWQSRGSLEMAGLDGRDVGWCGHSRNGGQGISLGETFRGKLNVGV